MSAPPAEQGLLESFIRQAVVDDYADVPPAADSRPWFRRHWPAAPATALIGVIVVAAVLTTRASDDQREATRAALTARVEALTAQVNDQQQAVEQQAATVQELRAGVLDDAALTAQAEAAQALEGPAGAADLRGPGVTVTVDDAPDAEAGSLNRVLDRDLQDIVNALWQMGAAGVAVNDQRLTATTAIRGAGEAILVNYQPLTRPYVVTAVGTTTTGDDDSGLQRLLAGLADDYGLVSQVTTGDVALPPGEVRSPRFAVPTPGEDQQ